MKAFRIAAAAAVVLSSLALVTTPSDASPAQTAATRAASTTSTGVTRSRTVQRTFTDAAGRTTVVDSRKVSVSVDATTDLRSLQLLHVNWSGARPTAGLVSDRNSDLAQNEEYPMALFECRGTDSAAHPLTPRTCWTQFADERFDGGSIDPPYPAWRSDSAATPAQRAAVVDAPPGAAQPTACVNPLYGRTYQRWVPYDGADGVTYAGGPFGCAGLAPEASPANLSSNTALPSNETFGVTDANGTGEADFDVFTGEDHASLGCSPTVACTLVAIPVVGLSCDPYGTRLPADQRPDADGVDAATTSCQASGNFAAGQLLPSQGRGAPAVSGALWWSPSNWNNRISIPLSFAPADDACGLGGTSDSVDIYGSELMAQASIQWSPSFCLNRKLFTLNHVQTPEPQARTLLSTYNIEGAYTSRQPDQPYPSPTVQAPVAVTGFGIAADVDDADGRPIAHLKLTARLIAKLLTQSYPAETFIKKYYPALANNPLNITSDPEFRALNPTVPINTAHAAATLFTLNSQSDVVEAMTRYMLADPDASAWLHGVPDPWGMVVNPNYRLSARNKTFQLPTNTWPLLDSFEPTEEYQPGRIDCLAGRNAVPYLPLVAAPTARLFTIAQNMQFALSQSQTTCVLPSPIPLDTTGAKMVADGRQASGKRLMFGVVSLGDAARRGLTLASLQTYTADSAAERFTNATGRTFVAPDAAGLRAAATLLKPDTATRTWPIPYATIDSAQGAKAYPGTMVVYAAVPTQGLPAGDGPRFGKVLAFAADAGQVPGTTQGRLPAGYLPMTGANGAADLAAFTRAAAVAVTQQQGVLPGLDGTLPGSPITEPPVDSGSTTGSGGGSDNGGFGNTGFGAGGAAPAGVATPATTPGARSAAPSGTAPTQVDPALASARTKHIGSGLGGWAMPIMLLVCLVAMVAALGMRLAAGRRG